MNFMAFITSPFAKIGGAALLVIAFVVGTHIWLDKRDQAAFQRGSDTKAAEVAAEVTRANENARLLEKSLVLIATATGDRANTQGSALTVKLEPLVKELTHEIQADRGADCAVSDGVRRTLKDQRAAVNAGVAASSPSQP